MEKDIRPGSNNQTMEKDSKHGDHNQTMEKDAKHGDHNQTMEKDAKHGDHNQTMEKDSKHGCKCDSQTVAKVKEQWSKLTQEEIERTEGKIDKLTALIKEKYSENQDKIKEKLNKLGIVS